MVRWCKITMTDEEKKAIDDLFALTHINGYIDLYKQDQAKIYTSDLSKWQNGVKTLLNLIENQQEEIEELKAHQIIFTNDYKPIGSKGRKFISEDKIKAKIEEYEKLSNNITMQPQIYPYIIEVLQSLLEKE